MLIRINNFRASKHNNFVEYHVNNPRISDCVNSNDKEAH